MCICVRVYICIYVYMYMCTCVYMYVRIYVYMYMLDNAAFGAENVPYDNYKPNNDLNIAEIEGIRAHELANKRYMYMCIVMYLYFCTYAYT